MKVVVQRVSRAEVRVSEKSIASIGNGLLVFLGVLEGDEEKDADLLAEKIVHLRIFEREGKMQDHLIQRGGKALVISQFTLAASYEKGLRPDFLKAAERSEALKLYEYFIKKLQSYVPTLAGIFGAAMEVELVNDGPATFVLNSRNFL